MPVALPTLVNATSVNPPEGGAWTLPRDIQAIKIDTGTEFLIEKDKVVFILRRSRVGDRYTIDFRFGGDFFISNLGIQ
jgi:hypothetical protein